LTCGFSAVIILSYESTIAEQTKSELDPKSGGPGKFAFIPSDQPAVLLLLGNQSFLGYLFCHWGSRMLPGRHGEFLLSWGVGKNFPHRKLLHGHGSFVCLQAHNPYGRYRVDSPAFLLLCSGGLQHRSSGDPPFFPGTQGSFLIQYVSKTESCPAGLHPQELLSDLKSLIPGP